MGKDKKIEHFEHGMNEALEQTSPVAIATAKNLLQAQENEIYVRKDAYTGDPYSFLGEVIIIRKEGGNCPGKFITEKNPEFFIQPVARKVNTESMIKEPIKASSFIVDKGIAAGVDALNYLSAELDTKSAFSVIVFKQAVGLVDVHNKEWIKSVKEWQAENSKLMDDDDICYILVVTGFSQKNIIRKKYYKLEASASGGAFGINLNGKAYTSTEDYSLDTIFGLDVRILKYPKVVHKSAEAKPTEEEFLQKPTAEQMKLFRSITSIKSR